MHSNTATLCFRGKRREGKCKFKIVSWGLKHKMYEVVFSIAIQSGAHVQMQRRNEEKKRCAAVATGNIEFLANLFRQHPV